MKARRAAVLGLALLALAACSKSEDRGFQGWIEADLIFVSPDEAGRVDALSVREGDAVQLGAPLFSVDPELQQADVDMAKHYFGRF
jgi:HlyD family secretion protein